VRNYVISLSSEPIVGGDYEGFRRHEVVVIPLWFSFWRYGYEISSDTSKRIVHVRDDLYELNAEVVYVDDRLSVIDFGLLATSFPGDWPSRVSSGSYVTGPTYLSVGYADYKQLRTRDGRTILTGYLWRVNRLQVVTGKRVPGRDRWGLPVLLPDESTFTYHEIEDTRPILYHPMLLDEPWPYRDPFICVLLHCTLLQDEPVAGP
jgi:hypothetical protein